MLKINIGQSFAVIRLIHNPKKSNLQFCGNTNFKFAILWQHKNWNWIFVLPQKKLLTKSFFVLPQLCKSDFCVATRFRFQKLWQHKVAKILDFLYLEKRKNKGELSPIFFGGFWRIQVIFGDFSGLEKLKNTVPLQWNSFFSNQKKTQTSFFLVEIAIDCTLKVHFQALPASSNARQHQLGQSCVPCTCNKQSRCAKKLQSFLISLSMLELTVQWSFHQLPALRLFVCFEKEALYSVKFAENKKELTWYLW